MEPHEKETIEFALKRDKAKKECSQENFGLDYTQPSLEEFLKKFVSQNMKDAICIKDGKEALDSGIFFIDIVKSVSRFYYQALMSIFKRTKFRVPEHITEGDLIEAGFWIDDITNKGRPRFVADIVREALRMEIKRLIATYDEWRHR